jgi:AcrR family transcriptional regulator
MVRWEPGTRERLYAAALELFATRGYEQTTAAEIAQSIGLSERTFFRHFADKREVLFAGQGEFLGVFLAGVADAPASAGPLELVTASLRAAATMFPDQRRSDVRLRQSVVAANAALGEREQHKMAVVAAALSGALRERGVDEPAATLAARSAITVFSVAVAQWVRPDEQRSMGELLERTTAELVALMTGRTMTRVP